MLLCRAMQQMLCAFRLMGLWRPDPYTLTAEETIFQHRFKDFACLPQPMPLPLSTGLFRAPAQACFVEASNARFVLV